MTAPESQEQRRFEADVRQILHLVTHSLYSDREIFLRELVSNASDALDRARFLSLSSEDILAPDGDPGVRLYVDEEAKTITISDDGIGLTSEQAAVHLGTIAKSGTKAFAEMLKEKGTDSDGLIGQFGVGFYSAFMVADKVTVQSLSGLPGAEAIVWESDGGESYTLLPGERTTRGTDVTLHLREDSHDFCSVDKVREIVQKHSDFVSWPVLVDGERANQEQALWTRTPSELEDDDYIQFYKHVSGDWQDPLTWLHVKIEGNIQFSAILFVPRKRPWELDRLDFKVGLKLYQKRVKILDHADALVPRFLRFVTGVVDSPDVDLNVSREILQQTGVVRAIRKQLTKRVLKKLKSLSREDAEAYNGFWGEMGHILKEGLHEDSENVKDLLTELLRYPTTKSEGELKSFAEVKASFIEKQDALWYFTSVDKERIGEAPVLEGFKKRDLEVVLMSDPVDEWVVMSVKDYDGTELKSAISGDLGDEEEAEEDPIAKAAKEQALPLVTWMQGMLEGDVAEVRVSNRLTSSPSVLVDQEGAMGSNLERILKAANQQVMASKRVLEINPEHPMVKTLARLNNEGATGLEPFARLLLDHAAIAEGRLDDPKGFATRLQALMSRAAEGMSGGVRVHDAPADDAPADTEASPEVDVEILGDDR
jgi:molecular chaperone HtpG